ncbi:MAG TPA: DNA polymerase, partial [Chloroflexota bacterium]
MNNHGRLMLIDGHALVHRAFHALPEDLSSASGEPTNAVLGFVNILLKEIETVNPTHIVLAMDRPSPTFRHQEYAEYKATRPKTPLKLVSQFARVREITDALHIPIYEVDGFEADDVLGTLAAQAERMGVETVILTGDLDALQLVSDSVHVRTPARGFQSTTTYDPAAVRERYGLESSQLPDWKALVGDTSDNIPGVKGIGGKSATQLIAQYGNLENVFSHLDELSPKWREALRGAQEQALQSKHLSQIVCDAPVTIDLERASRAAPDRARLVELFTELSFERLLDRLYAGAFAGQDSENMPVPAEPHSSGQLSLFADEQDQVSGTQQESRSTAVATALELLRETAGVSTTTHTVIVDDEGKLEALKAALQNSERIAFDCETTSTDPLAARLVGLSFANEAGSAWYVPVGHTEGKQLSIETVLDSLRPILENVSLFKIGHNLKYDLNALSQYDVFSNGIGFDTMIAAYLVNQEARGLSLSSLAQTRLGIEMTPIERLIGKGKDQITMDLVPIDTVSDYAGADADVSLQLADRLAVELEEREVTNLFRDIEMPLVPVLAAMEREGVALNTSVLTDMSREMTEVMGRLEVQIFDVAGRAFNINSTQQLSQLLFNQLKLPPGRRTKTGYSTDNEVLESLRGKHTVVDAILEFRQLMKLKNTYVDALPSLINPRTGRVHTDFNQTVAST